MSPALPRRGHFAWPALLLLLALVLAEYRLGAFAPSPDPETGIWHYSGE